MKEIFKQIKRFSEIDFEEGKPFEFTLEGKRMEVGKSYKITVKKYMTEPATVNFDFQDKWNNGKPMPLCIMQGETIKETRGMYYMELKAEDTNWEGWVIKSAIKEWEEI